MYSINDNKDENFDIAFFRNTWNFNCKVCGFNNKLFRVIINRDNKIIGYSLTCCQCGRVHEFHIDIEDNGVYNLLTSNLFEFQYFFIRNVYNLSCNIINKFHIVTHHN